MTNVLRSRVYLSVSVLCLGLALPAAASTIFDNSAHDLVTRFNPGTLEVGDEIVLAGSDRLLTDFSFEYWGENTTHADAFTGTIEARVQFYQNTGALFNGYAAPAATSFYSSDWCLIPAPTNRATFTFTSGLDWSIYGLPMPVESNMTWSVQFRGMAGDDSVGVDLYSPPVVGADYPDYWQNDGTGWALMTNSPSMDFAARMEATVPEPSTLALSVCGGLGLLILARRLRRKE